MAEFRRCGFTENAPGPETRLTVTVKAPATSHEVQWGLLFIACSFSFPAL
jgi:pectin methylesterase-like acyl-CoA thioesterase